MSYGPLISHVAVFICGILFGAFALRRNPVKGAKTLDELERVYGEAKAKLLSKEHK